MCRERFILRNWLMWLWGFGETKFWWGRLETQERGEFKSKGSLLGNQEKQKLQWKLEGRLLAEFLLTRGSSVSVLISRLSTDQMRSGHIRGESALLRLHQVKCQSHSKKKEITFTETSRLTVDQISVHRVTAKLAHKTNHHSTPVITTHRRCCLS